MKTEFIAFRTQITGPPVDSLIAWIRELGPNGSVLLDATRRALVLGVLRNVRRRFLNRMGVAQQVFIDNSSQMSKRDRQLQAARERSSQKKAKARLSAAYEKLDKAVLQGDEVRAGRARSNLQRRATDVVYTALGVSNVGRKANSLSEARANRILGAQLTQDVRTGSSGRIGLLMNGLMKQRQLLVLEQLTSASEIFENHGPHSVTLSTGRAKRLEAIDTPSATAATTGKRSPSPKRTLWRQLEFGAGKDRIDSSLNPVSNTRYRLPENGWFFGPLVRSAYRGTGLSDNDRASDGDGEREGSLGKYGLRVRGIKPMQFLFKSGETAYDEDAEAALKYFDEAMRASAPQF